jgi:hypothetical protein
MPEGVWGFGWFKNRQGRIFIGLKESAQPFPIPCLSRPFSSFSCFSSFLITGGE